MPKRSRKFTYSVVAALVISLSLLGGWLLSESLTSQPSQSIPSQDTRELIDQYFAEALEHMHNKHYHQAVDSWQKLLLLNDRMPEAHVNLGFTLYELGRFHAARDHFLIASDLNAYQANAYYGLAICSEQLGDIPVALGAMRSFVHLAEPDDPFVRKARAAIWEWESRRPSPGVTADDDSVQKEPAAASEENQTRSGG